MRRAAAAILVLSACGGSQTPCKPGGDGSYLDAPYATLDKYCLVSLEGNEVRYAGGVVPYDLNTPLFSDDMFKRRAVFVPPGKSAAYDADAPFDFPAGTVLIKSFGAGDDLRKPQPQMRWVETRLLVRAADGWHGYAYIWDDAQKTATWTPGGKIAQLALIDAQGVTQQFDYLIPSATQCKQCHQDSGTMLPIGARARNLNRDFAYVSGVENQLAHWTRTAMLAGAPDPASAPRMPVWNDPATGSVEQRARAYLEVNCAHCHGQGGAASTSGLFLSAAEQDPLHYGVCKEPLSAGAGAGGLTWDVLPGDPDHSIVWYRMASTQPGIAMPQIGRSLVHQDGVDLVRAWITGLPHGPCNN